MGHDRNLIGHQTLVSHHTSNNTPLKVQQSTYERPMLDGSVDAPTWLGQRANARAAI